VLLSVHLLLLAVDWVRNHRRISSVDAPDKCSLWTIFVLL
jgi:hypothetical protein